MPSLSLVIAAYNEEENLTKLYDRLIALNWVQLGFDPEFVFVDDHSGDDTPKLLADLASRDPRVKVLRFSKNFGSHKAYTAGLEHCTGHAAVILASDLQDPPETIPDLVGKWRNGAKVVWAVRGKREGESLTTIFLSKFFYFLMRRFSEVPPPKNGGDFLLLDRIVIEALREAPERNTSLLSLIQWLGFDQDQIIYTKAERHGGRSKWTVQKKIKLAIDSFVSFSYAPVRLMSACGIIFASTGFVYAAIIIARAVFYSNPVPGWSSLMCVTLVVSGVQLTMIGVLGEYLWRTLDESRHRPRYVVERKINF